MPRFVTLDPPTRGIDLVSSTAKVPTGFLSKGENIVLTRGAVRRALAKLAAYIWPLATATPITLLHRFYNLATTGTVDKMVIAANASGSPLWRNRTSWSDDSKTLITTGWTQLLTPRPDNNTLYAGYDAGPIALTASLNNAVQANSWLYMWPDYVSGDDASDIVNVPMRTQGGMVVAPDNEVFLHGLVPPLSLDSADYANHRNVPATAEWAFQQVGGGPGGAVLPKAVMDSIGRIHICYQEAAGVFNYQVLTGSVWSAIEIIAGATVGTLYYDIAVDSNDVPHVVWYDTGIGFTDLRYQNRSTGAWPGSTIVDNVAADVGSYCSMVIDESDNIHVAYYDTTNTQLKYAVHISGNAVGTWTREVVDTAGAVGEYCSIAVDSKNIPHISYYDNTNNRLLYVNRTTGVWTTTPEVVHDPAVNDVGQYTSIAIDSGDVPAISYIDVTAADVLYAKRDGGTWSTLETISSTAVTPTDTKLVFDQNDLAHVLWSENATALSIGIRVNGTWASNIGVVSTTHAYGDLLVGDDGRLHVLAGMDAGAFSAQYAFVDNAHYFYILTAEYDDGILGESGPSAATEIIVEKAIDINNVHLLDLTPIDTRYNMTKDVTRIHIYRTVAGADTDGTYYRVGTVTCTAGVPTDFTDNVADVDLVANTILDKDKYLPPKYTTAVYWKDRLVIANLKCRAISSPASTTELDAEATGIHKNRIRYSMGFFPDIFRANFFQDVLPDTDSGSIQRLIVNSKLDLLFVLFEDNVVALGDPRGDRVSSLSAPVRNIAGAKGTPSPDSAVYHDGRLFYFTKHGIEMIDGLESRSITTHTIAPLWNLQDTTHPSYANRINMGQLSLVQGTVSLGGTWERIYWAYPRASSTFNDCILVLHYDLWKMRGFTGDPPFTIRTNIRAAKFMRWDGEGDRGELFAGEANGALRPWIYRLDIGNKEQDGTATATPADAVMPVSIVYPGLTDAGSRALKAWQDVWVDIKGVSSAAAAQSVVLKFDVDEGKETYPLTLDTYGPAPDGASHPRRNVRKIPRTAIGVHGGALLEITDVFGIDYPDPWELYSISYGVNDLRSRHRGERNT